MLIKTGCFCISGMRAQGPGDIRRKLLFFGGGGGGCLPNIFNCFSSGRSSGNNENK